MIWNLVCKEAIVTKNMDNEQSLVMFSLITKSQNNVSVGCVCMFESSHQTLCVSFKWFLMSFFILLVTNFKVFHATFHRCYFLLLSFDTWLLLMLLVSNLVSCNLQAKIWSDFSPIGLAFYHLFVLSPPCLFSPLACFSRFSPIFYCYSFHDV